MRKGTALNVVEKLATVNEYISEGIVQDDYQIEGIEHAFGDMMTSQQATAANE